LDTDPSRLVADQDSLLAAEPENKELVEALVKAHLVLAQQLIDRGNTQAAQKEYLSVLDLNKKNADANYYLAMARGRECFRKGSRMELWNAIEEFSRAARYLPTRGEPHYWVGRAYEKKDDGDFELIVESYERAFILELAEDQRNDCELRLKKVRERQETFNNFWK
jgi:tetratricopeptide (TPR) repeat protein